MWQPLTKLYKGLVIAFVRRCIVAMAMDIKKEPRSFLPMARARGFHTARTLMKQFRLLFLLGLALLLGACDSGNGGGPPASTSPSNLNSFCARLNHRSCPLSMALPAPTDGL